ncbi:MULTISPECIES: helix-turn-helix domain-containing protein [unclassified Rhodococcus (in: high G+C Gram-positive bacteria)]|uniref:sigma-54-dependent Fis family transcriptional regulator n=1 Tax=unclassified Rhodococcus (in: high G+C Gram-positive bacteria) TaxID=192944 RepID=UPI00163B0B10|nr:MULTISPECIES: helix-turn-helix domain-containing protein [unclassified Rhodococcus (in: high G+C Gram-positive bacteria)]MBC2641873.1 sigma 54-interacting transcriptional regulator [Rhodococcus sp. 3A]MBC2893384.1 sigma 54-interacting transcriptional regulator [Rhodococcus sp. 4CII]
MVTDRSSARADDRSLDADEGAPLRLRPEIEQSWRRCRAIGAAPDGSRFRFIDDTYTDSKLIRAARPVVDRLAEQLADTPVTILLADQDATIVDRRTGVRSLLGRLDRAQVAPGFMFSEEYAGTNGIGTALEERKAFRVRGGEHMLESLQSLACVGSPIVDPVSRTVVGILDITCNVDQVSDLMAPLIFSAVREVEERLFDQSAKSEQVLLREYMRSKRRGNAAVVAMSPDTVIATPTASRLMDSTDQMMIWDWISSHLGTKQEWEGPLRFADGIDVRVHARRVSESGEQLSAILELRPMVSSAVSRPHTAVLPASRHAPATESAGRIVGRSLATHRLQSRIDEIAGTVGPVLVTGESGVGKSHVARYIQQRWGHDGDIPVIDGSTLTPETVTDLRARLSSNVPWIVEHVDEIPDDAVAPTRRLLDAAATMSAPIVATATSTAPDGAGQQVHTHVRRSVSVSPLRQRIEDLDDLARELLGAHLPGRPTPQLQPAAHRALVAHHWPGNVRELDAVLCTAIARSMGFDIRLEHLPDDYRALGSGRQLTSLERSEREAIVRALDEADGNKSLAADRLGVARSTLYRKIRALGLENERFGS